MIIDFMVVKLKEVYKKVKDYLLECKLQANL